MFPICYKICQNKWEYQIGQQIISIIDIIQGEKTYVTHAISVTYIFLHGKNCYNLYSYSSTQVLFFIHWKLLSCQMRRSEKMFLVCPLSNRREFQVVVQSEGSNTFRRAFAWRYQFMIFLRFCNAAGQCSIIVLIILISPTINDRKIL